MHHYERYAEFYKGLAHKATAQWALILSDDPETIRMLEPIVGMTQTQAVDDFIETSCWSEDLPQFVGGQGIAEGRRKALCELYRKARSGRNPADLDFELLTPLEHDLFKLVHAVILADCAKGDLKRSLTRAYDATRAHVMKLMEKGSNE